MRTASDKFFVVSFLLALLFALSTAQDWKPTTRLFFFFKDNEAQIISLSANANGFVYTNFQPASCACEPATAFSCGTIAPSGTDGLTLKITPLASGPGGICSLTINGASSTISGGNFAFIEDLKLAPQGRPVSATQDFSLALDTAPVLTQAQLNSVLEGTVFLQATTIPSVTMSSAGNQATFTLTKANRDTLTSVLPIIDSYWNVDLELVQSMTPVNRFQITRPLLLYNDPTLATITPNLMRVNDEKQFTVTSAPGSYFTDTSAVNIKFGTLPTVREGTLLSSSSLTFMYSFDGANPLVAGNAHDVSISFDKDSYFFTSGVRVYAFDFPTDFKSKISYSNPSGCPIFGGSFGTVTFDMGTSIPAGPFRAQTPKLQIKDAQFSREIACNWVANTIVCNCIEIWDLNINLPHQFKLALQLNGRDWYESASFPVLPYINYFKPDQFLISPAGKFPTDSITQINITNIDDRYAPGFMYRYKLKNKVLNREDILACAPVPDVFPTVVTCNISSTSTLSYLCGVDVTNITAMTKPCTLAVVSNIARSGSSFVPVDFEAKTSFVIYAYFGKVVSVTPQSVELNSAYNVTVTLDSTGQLLSNNGNLKYRLIQKADPYLATGEPYNPANPLILSGDIRYVSDTVGVITTTFPKETLYDIQISLNGITYEYLYNLNSGMSRYDLRVYTESSLIFNSFTGTSEGNKTKPIPNNVNITGSHFFPSPNMKIRYIQSQLILNDVCQFNETNLLICRTPNVLDYGIALPMTFNIYISMNGFKYISTGLTVEFEKSDKPVIVQVVPQRGPFYVAERYRDIPNSAYGYAITVKGITKGVNRCIFQKKMSENDPLEDDNIPKGISLVDQSSDEEVECKVPVHDTNFQKGNASDWRLYLEDTTTNQRSDPFIIQFYDDPQLFEILPAEGNAFGKETVLIRGSGFMESLRGSITFKLQDTRSDSKCNWLSTSEITCVTPAHPEGSYPVYISYNDYQFKRVGNTSVLYNVKACSAGNYSKDFDTPCKPCEPGTYKPLAGFFECIDCEVARYQPDGGMDRCIKCPAFTITRKPRATNILDCDCEPGYYRKNGTSPGIICTQCPLGGICDGEGALPIPQSGYWWDQANSDAGDRKFIKCNKPELCTGDINDNGGCVKGHTGVTCESCQKEFYKSSGRCLECGEDVRSRFAIVVILIIVLVLVSFRFAQTKVTYLSSVSVGLSFFQIIAVFSGYNFKWPESLKNALNILKIFNFDLDIFVPECISSITYGMKYGATLAMPAVFLVLIIVLFILECLRTLLSTWIGKAIRHKVEHLYAVNKKNWIIYQLTLLRRDILLFFTAPKTRPELLQFIDKLIHTFVVIVVFSYVFVITKAAEIFNCETLTNGKRVIGSYKEQECFTGDWFIYLPFALTIMVFFGAGTMLIFAFIVLNKKKIVTNKQFNDRFRFLFVRFRNERLYWELLIVMRKLLISMAVVFFSGYPMLVILFTMFVTFCAFILQTHHVPFRRHFHNVMEYVVLLSTEFLLFSALLFYVDEFPEDWNKDALGYICIITVVVTTVVVVLLVICDIYSQMREETMAKRKRRAEKLQRVEAQAKVHEEQEKAKKRLSKKQATKTEEEEEEEEEEEAAPVPLSVQIEQGTLQAPTAAGANSSSGLTLSADTSLEDDPDMKDNILDKFIDFTDVVWLKITTTRRSILLKLRLIKPEAPKKPEEAVPEPMSATTDGEQELRDIPSPSEAQQPVAYAGGNDNTLVMDEGATDGSQQPSHERKPSVAVSKLLKMAKNADGTPEGSPTPMSPNTQSEFPLLPQPPSDTSAPEAPPSSTLSP